MKTFAVIPTKWESPTTTLALLHTILFDGDVDEVIFIDNGGDSSRVFKEGEPLHSKVNFLKAPGKTIYEMWNYAWDIIRTSRSDYGDFNIAFLNDDIELPPHALALMKRFLRSDRSLAAIYPDVEASWIDYISGWYNKKYWIEYGKGTSAFNGGLVGYCFMVPGELDEIRFDENLKLYWGDDDFVKKAHNLGLNIGKIVGVPIKHIGSATIKKMDPNERYEIMEKDRAYFNQKYGENREPVW